MHDVSERGREHPARGVAAISSSLDNVLDRQEPRGPGASEAQLYATLEIIQPPNCN